MNAIDTNVLVYFIDQEEPAKRSRAIELLEGLLQAEVETVLPWQVAVEFLSCLRKWENAGRIHREDTMQHVRLLESTFRLVFPGQSLLQSSLNLSSRYSLSHWDSMLIAACMDASITVLYSEDLQGGANYDGVTVVNPFASI